MNWFSPYRGLIIAAFMIPNIIFAIKCKGGFANLWHNKAVEVFEQVGRFGCMAFMLFDIPYTVFGFWFAGAERIYFGITLSLTFFYCLIWMVFFRQNCIFRALALSILPSAIFLFSGVMLLSVPLILSAVIFAPCHILLSYKNAVLADG